MDTALRTVNEEATFKPSTLQSALLKFDKKNDCKFSKAAKMTPDDWAQASREKVRDVLRKENKRRNSQKWRDDQKDAAEEVQPKGSKSQQAEPKKKEKMSNAGEVPPGVECAIPGYKGPTKLIAVPEAISEEVLAAALKAAMAAATLQIGNVIVSAPSGFKSSASSAKSNGKAKEKDDEAEEDEKGEEEEGDEGEDGDDDDEEEEDEEEDEDEGDDEDEGEDDEDEDEGDEEGTGDEGSGKDPEDGSKAGQHKGNAKAVKKRPASVDPPLPDGWKKLTFLRSSGQQYYMFESPAGKRFRSMKEVGRALGAD